MFRLRSLLCAATCAVVGLSISATAADWPGYHRAAGNDVVQPIESTIQSLPGPSWQTSTSQQLVAGAGVIVAEGKVISTAATGSDTWADPGDDTFRLKAFDAVTGALVWNGPLLPPGGSVANATLSTPLVITSPMAMPMAFIGVGNQVHCLSVGGTTPIWSTALTTTNTTPGLGGYEIVNSSPVGAGGHVIVEVAGGNFNPADKQIVALNAGTGAVSWFHADGGQGLGTPAVHTVGPDQVVYTATQGGIAAYNAANGTQVWTNRATLAGSTWTLARDIWGSMVVKNNRLYATTYSFAGSGVRLVCVDPATGELLFNVPTLTSDVVPLVLGSRVYVQGGPFGAARLAAYDAVSGAEIFNVATGGTSFRTIMAATNDRIYMTNGSTLAIHDPANGALLGSYPGGFDGAVAIGVDGAVYAHNGTALAAFRQFVPVELSYFGE